MMILVTDVILIPSMVSTGICTFVQSPRMRASKELGTAADPLTFQLQFRLHGATSSPAPQTSVEAQAQRLAVGPGNAAQRREMRGLAAKLNWFSPR